MRRTLAVFLLCLWLPLAGLAQVKGDVAPPVFRDGFEEARFRQLTHELRCVMCQNQSLADSNAEIARDHGARGVFLATMSIQAPGFYPRMGYRECGRMEDYPVAGERLHHFVKTL